MNEGEQQAAVTRSPVEAAGDEMATWLDFYANVCKDTKDTEYAGHARRAVEEWERLVPHPED